MSFFDYLKDKRVLGLLLVIIALAALDYAFGPLHLGIEFAGGTQIPVTLEHSVSANQTNQIISILQQRLSTFGLKQISIEGVGNTQVLIDIPSVNQSDIQSTISLIQSQGEFQGIVNGRVAVDGSGILSGSVGSGQPTVIGSSVSWSVNFYITQQAAVQFSKIVFGQANKPIFMYLDRPTSAIVLLNTSLMGTSLGSTQQAEIASLQNVLSLGNRTIPLELLSPGASNWGTLYKFFQLNAGRYKTVIIQNNTPAFIRSNLTSLNYTLRSVTGTNMTPAFQVSTNSSGLTTLLNSWPAVGLLSAPILNPSITNGNISESYTISGYAPSTIPVSAQVAYATGQSQLLQSILTGGALPVQVIVGTPTVTQPTLGAQFETISVIALVLAVIAVSMVIAVRYKKMFLVAPILLTTLAELFIILSIVGLIGTIDLAAVAGMIAVIGTGVDAQIIISDEILNKGTDSTMKTRLNNAFYVVYADAFLLVVAMLPLFFSTSLVSVIGFSESTIIGALLGAFVTRPSYAAILSKHYSNVGGITHA
jgi:preprotein translocase subunit SecD